MSTYMLFQYTVKYRVYDTEKVAPIDRVAQYNVSAPSEGVAEEEIRRVFHRHHDLELSLAPDPIVIHCAIQVVRWGLGVDS